MFIRLVLQTSAPPSLLRCPVRSSETCQARRATVRAALPVANRIWYRRGRLPPEHDEKPPPRIRAASISPFRPPCLRGGWRGRGRGGIIPKVRGEWDWQASGFESGGAPQRTSEQSSLKSVPIRLHASHKGNVGIRTGIRCSEAPGTSRSKRTSYKSMGFP